MTKAQKIIKFIALSLAIFLIFSIISLILKGSYVLLNGLGLINTNDNIITENLKTISNEQLKIETLKIDLAYTNLYIKTGEKFEVQTNNTKITFENDNGHVKIKEKNSYFLDAKNVESNLIIYLPSDTPIINEVDIDAGAGKIDIARLNTKELYFELGAGEVYIENVIVTDNIDIDGGVGKTELVNCNLNNLKADLGVGAFLFNGTLTGKNEINSGVGAVNINLKGKREDYTINTSKGVGNITLDEEKMEADRVYGNGSHYLEVDGGIGEINIKFIN